MNAPVGKQDPSNGDVWTGFEWVTPRRYCEMRDDHHHLNLPVIQPVFEKDVLAPPIHERAQPQNTADAPVAYEGTFDHLDFPELPRADFGPFTPFEDLVSAMNILISAVDPEPTRGGLVETRVRAARAWEEWMSGYTVSAVDILKVFEDGAEDCDEMVVVKDIPVYSHCEHHLAPIFGTATVGYLPNKRIVGLSKINRLVDMYARRLQVQERMTNQIARAMMEHLNPKGVGVVLKARHFCMESRGIKQTGSVTITSAMLGAFREDATVRAEFLALTR